MDLNLKDKVVLISGASKGIGKACTDLYLKEGATVIAIARDVSSLVQTDNLIPLAIDVSSEKDLEDLKILLSTRFSKIDILINNVGTNIRKSTLEYKSDDFQKMFDVNLRSAYLLSKIFLESAQSGACIVNVSSVASERSITTSTLVYSMTKAAMNQMTKFLASEFGGKGIRVNSVLPWYIETDLVKSVLSDPHKLKPILDKTPLNRVGQPEEVANAIAFLSSGKASYITGALIPVDGGYLSQG